MNHLLLIGGMGWQELLVVAFIFLLLFGGKKLPELMRGMGKGVRSFKEGMNDMTKEINDEKTEEKKEEK